MYVITVSNMEKLMKSLMFELLYTDEEMACRYDQTTG